MVAAREALAMADDQRIEAAVAAADAMTRRWIEGLGPGSTAISTTAWPLLATLVDAATGPARQELAAAVGLDGAEATAAARALVQALEADPAVAIALSAWVHRTIELERAWQEANDHVALRTLDGQGPIDEWVREGTAGRIEACPITVDEDTLALLLCAASVDTTWEQRTQPTSLRAAEGPWAERWFVALRQTAGDPDTVEVVEGGAGPVTVATLRTNEGIDVRLAIAAPDASPLVALREAVAHLAGERSSRPGSDVIAGTASGPALQVVAMRSADPDAPPTLNLVAPAFDVDVTHDLLDLPAVFGLDSCTDPSRGHFPGLSPSPLAVGQAQQAVRCTMDHEGFRAASVTAVGMLAGAGLPQHEVPCLLATFDRPFAFVAHDRATGLVLFAGVIEEPLADP